MKDSAGVPNPVGPPLRNRLLIATGITAVFACLTWFNLYIQPEAVANDYTWYWRGARAILDGHSPYQVVKPTGVYPFDAAFNYPLTTALLVMPLAALRPIVGATIFVAVFTFMLAFAITRDGYARLPLFLSIPFYFCWGWVQLAPFVMVAALMPAAAWLAAIKPNLWIAVFMRNLSARMVVAPAIFILASLIVDPRWPLDWLHTVTNHIPGNYGVPILSVAGGPLLLLALTRWRRPEARLLFAMAVVPQSLLFYDQLLLWLIPRTFIESAILSLCSVAALVFGLMGLPEHAKTTATFSHAYAPAIVGAIYLPALIMVMRRPNEGSLPSWLGRFSKQPKSPEQTRSTSAGQ